MNWGKGWQHEEGIQACKSARTLKPNLADANAMLPSILYRVSLLGSMNYGPDWPLRLMSIAQWACCNPRYIGSCSDKARHHPSVKRRFQVTD